MASRFRGARRWAAAAAACGAMGWGGTAAVRAQQPGPAPDVSAAKPAPAAAPEVAPWAPDPDPAPTGQAGGGPAGGDGGDIFKNVPPTRVPSRPGFFAVPPAGPGYYSLLDALTGNYRQGPPKYPYPRFAIMPPSFYDVDFRYLDDPNNTETDFFDPLKRVRIGDNWMFSTGGQTWTRFMNEYNSRLTEANNNYNLTRIRTYGDLWYRDEFRLFAEFIGAYSNWQDLAPLPIDVNRADFLNLFMDLKAGQLAGQPVYVRVGRQELYFGSQRLVSALDWANTRRTFQGVRAFRTSENLDVDVFWTRPVVINPGQLDWWDNNQDFFGAFATYRPAKGQAIDAYYLGLLNRNAITQQGIVRGPYDVHTFGARYVGNRDNFLWEFEGALQGGSRGPEDIFAGMAVAGLGYNFKDAPLNPTFWAYYNYFSGDNNPNAGGFHTFNQLFPFGHYYNGWIDLVGLQNVHDFNLQLYLYPTKWVTLWLQYHDFWLAAARDALYNKSGVAYRRDPTGRSGTHVGQELDVITNFHVTQHADILTGYSYLFGGEFLRRTAGPNQAVNSGLWYLQFNYRW